MLKHILALLILSVLVILLLHPFALLVYATIYLHNLIMHLLSGVFAGDYLGMILKQSIGLVIVPMIFTVLPGLIYWLITRREVGYFYWLTWAFWLMLVTAIALHK